MIEVKHLYKRFTSVVAVNDVSFRVEPGKVLGLLGPNGAGKTTTIRIILNIIRADSGIILFDKNPFDNWIQNKIGYLPEERGLYRKHKLIHTIQYLAGLKGISREEAYQKGMYWLGRFQLRPYANKKIEELSKGNQQKVQFIISILHDPRYIVLDEPFSGLDPVNQLLLKDIMEELRSAGKIIIFSTHQMEQAEKMCDDICIINRGRVVLYGPLTAEKKKFGTNTVEIEYTGDGSGLRNLKGIYGAAIYSNYAELQISDNVDAGEIIRQASNLVGIRKFVLKEPTLNSIFIKLVGSTVEEIEREHEEKIEADLAT